ncbi:hypothetical protein LY76DRAFT_328604 [Colletotrichum caudatum]|nr:hypothetical protein LY76DRAFT_328604 [Colletotrichum caudatum]
MTLYHQASCFFLFNYKYSGQGRTASTSTFLGITVVFFFGGGGIQLYLQIKDIARFLILPHREVGMISHCILQLPSACSHGLVTTLPSRASDSTMRRIRCSK